MKNTDGWLQTDGSGATLQYGRNVGGNSWEYREWLDLPHTKGLSAEDKIKDWDNPNWREDVINLNNYSTDQIEDAISVYGYKIVGKIPFKIEQGGQVFNFEDSVQLACECIFELEL